MKRNRKFRVGDVARANDLAPGDYRDRLVRITTIGDKPSDYGFEALDDKAPRTGFLASSALDAVHG